MATASPATNGPSLLDLPDEELAKYASPEALFAAHPELAAAAAAGADADAANEDDADPNKEGAEDDDAGEAGQEGRAEGAAEEDADDQKELNQEGQGAAEGAAPGSTPPAKEGEPAKGQQQKPAEGEKKPEGEKAEAPKAEAGASDAELATEFKKLLAPFKAAGREMQVRNADEILQLMQMGVGYASKMQQLKPNLQILKTLQKNELLDPDKLNFVIDLVVRKDPAAINKFLKDNSLDPMNLDPEKAGEYKPTNHQATPQDVDVELVLDEIETSPHFQRVISVVTKEWDAASKARFSREPHLMKVLDAHMKGGYFDLISNELHRLRTLGQIPASVSDVDAYQQIGDAMHAAGKFAHLVPGQSQGQQTPPVKKIEVPPKSDQADEAKRNEKRRAASTSRPAAPVTKPNFNPLEMSDEEFMKLDMNKFR